MKNIEWKTSTGLNIKVTVSAVYGLTGAGIRKTSGAKQVEVKASIDGADHFCPMGYQKLETPQGPAVARIGDIGVIAENAAKIEEAIAEVAAEVNEHNAPIEAHAKHLDTCNGDINKWSCA